jgi:hypothetical protein
VRIDLVASAINRMMTATTPSTAGSFSDLPSPINSALQSVFDALNRWRDGEIELMRLREQVIHLSGPAAMAAQLDQDVEVARAALDEQRAGEVDLRFCWPDFAFSWICF